MPSKLQPHSSCRILLLVLLAGLTACGASSSADLPSPIQITLSTPIPPFILPTPPPKTLQPADTLLQHWLQDTACTPPCWAGITPGQTPVQQAVEILNRHPFVTRMAFDSLPSDVEGTLIWKWTESDQGGGILGFRQHEAAPVVAWISVNFGRAYSLYQITDAFGEPSHVVPSFVSTTTAHFGATTFYDFTLVYLSRRFYVEAGRTYAEPPTIAPGMAWSGWVSFFPPSATGFDAAVQYRTGMPFRSADLILWKGFQDFTTYCQL